jgi:hypothetical protein
MKQSGVRWERAGMRGAGLLVSDTMMFQRVAPNPSDVNLSSFYGLALPLLKRGLPVEPAQIENASAPSALTPYRLLLLTYEGQKPPTPEFHTVLAQWVRDGGALVVVDDDRDPYCAVCEWWNTAPLNYKTPREHLFEALGIPRDDSGVQRVGRGVVVRENASPAALTYKADGAEIVRGAARRAAAAVGLEWSESNALVLRRGPYVIAAGLDESTSGVPPATLHGPSATCSTPGCPLCATWPFRPAREQYSSTSTRLAVDNRAYWWLPAACAMKGSTEKRCGSGPKALPTPKRSCVSLQVPSRSQLPSAVCQRRLSMMPLFEPR